ncbi:MAG: right-handed parallel beta-helix repeat-containing protein [Kiritimatiellae bacterium]|nr:right-handed parallel beta-helix repeat-containing protein [Kiritimatiellia bacterium]
MTTTKLTPDLSPSDLQTALNAASPGDRLLFAPGIYRASLRMTRSGTAEHPIVLEAEVPGQTVITGADVLTGWAPCEKMQGAFELEVDLSHLTPEPKYGPLIGRKEQVFVDGQPLRQVLHLDQLTPGAFCYQDAEKKLCIFPQAFTGELSGGATEIDAGGITGGGTVAVDRDDPANCWQFLLRPFDPAAHCIEVTTRAEIFAIGAGRERGEPAHVHVKGLVFRASGDAPQQPMVRFCGQHLLIENCLFEFGATRGFDLRADHSVMRGCVARLNGQMGFSGYGDHNLIEDCALLYNNTKHSDFVCFEQGGCKIVRTGHWTVRRVRCTGNDGPGIWFDIDNHDAVIEQCWCEGNSGPGIMYEISRDADIRNNVCYRNGHAYTKDQRFNAIHNSVGHMEPVYGQGILVQMSRNTRVYNNTCVENRRCGIELRHHPYQQAGNPGHSKETYRLRDNQVVNNLLADNGWDNQGWDNLMISPAPENPLKHSEVRDNLHDYNLFHSTLALLQHQGNLAAYCRWGKTQRAGSMSLEEWRAGIHQDLHSIQWDPLFVAPKERDFRLEPGSPALGKGKPVPDLKVDYHGNPRPETPGIGAFEAVSLGAGALI